MREGAARPSPPALQTHIGSCRSQTSARGRRRTIPHVAARPRRMFVGEEGLGAAPGARSMAATSLASSASRASRPRTLRETRERIGAFSDGRRAFRCEPVPNVEHGAQVERGSTKRPDAKAKGHSVKQTKAPPARRSFGLAVRPAFLLRPELGTGVHRRPVGRLRASADTGATAPAHTLGNERRTQWPPQSPHGISRLLSS